MRRRSASHPDFISIGSARCGSTWLAERLRRHPGVWIPPIKEIHYFDMQRVLPPWHWIRLRRYGIHLRRYVEHLLRRDEGGGEDLGHELRWGLRYFLLPRSDEWYRSVMTPPAGRLAGEVTPAYCMLDDVDFQRMADEFPSTKFIFAMRNPIGRDWSQAVMHLDLHRRKGEPEEYLKEILEVLDREQVVARSSYLDVLARLDRLPSDRVHIFFFDRIREDPFGTLRDICDFLGIEADDRMLDETANRKVATRDMRGRTMPNSVESMLAKRWLPMIDELAERFGGPPSTWAADARATIDGAVR